MIETTMATDPQTLQAATFLAEALDLADDPATLAADLNEIEREPDLTTYLIQLESSVGPAAFLIYAYRLASNGAEDVVGRERFRADLALFETVARQSVPGPRVLAHALTDEHGFILATSPDVLRSLTGAAEPLEAEARPADLLPPGLAEGARATAAGELLRLLRLANDQAANWLSALAASRRDPDAPPTLPFSPEETELALFLLDDRSIQDLLSVLNALLTAAREQTAEAMTNDG
jgi:hypothetical protein